MIRLSVVLRTGLACVIVLALVGLVVAPQMGLLITGLDFVFGPSMYQIIRDTEDRPVRYWHGLTVASMFFGYLLIGVAAASMKY